MSSMIKVSENKHMLLFLTPFLSIYIELIQRLFEIALVKDSKHTVMAVDALRNLYVQACIIDRPLYSSQILKCGLV